MVTVTIFLFLQYYGHFDLKTNIKKKWNKAMLILKKKRKKKGVTWKRKNRTNVGKRRYKN